MAKSLYCVNDPSIGGLTFGIKPYDPKYWATYGAMSRRIGLKADLRWHEVHYLQNILRKADIWVDFPAKGYTLVGSEFKAADEDQRLDILYMRNDGALLPCELKLGGSSKNSFAQLIRYTADLWYQEITLAWVKTRHQLFLDSIQDDTAKTIHSRKFEDFTAENKLTDRVVRLLPRSGVVIDEGFDPACLKAVRYLNGYCGFSIRLIELQTFAPEDWSNASQEYMFRIDFVDVD